MDAFFGFVGLQRLLSDPGVYADSPWHEIMYTFHGL